MPTVVCTRWLDAFPASYVTVLRNAVAANLDREHRFICVTDRPQDLTDGVEGVELPDMGIPLEFQKRGCWPKLGIFKEGLLPAGEPTLYLDLDVVILRDLGCYFDQIQANGGFNALREWNPPPWHWLPLSMRPYRGIQGSVLGFFPEQQGGVYEKFMANREYAYDEYVNDQLFLNDHVTDLKHWPYPWAVSFKRHCMHYYPLSRWLPPIPKPAAAKMVVFHGTPRPIDVVPEDVGIWGSGRRRGHGPVSWVREYWLRHDVNFQDVK